jgi:hypothetical protein
MQKLDLEEFETNITVRPITPADFEQLVQLQEQCFPGMSTWHLEQIESQTTVFPEGQICLELRRRDRRLVQQPDRRLRPLRARGTPGARSSDNGYIRNHDPEGDTLYGIEIMVSPEYRGHALGPPALPDARKELAREIATCGASSSPAASPASAKHADEMSAARSTSRRVMRQRTVRPGAHRASSPTASCSSAASRTTCRATSLARLRDIPRVERTSTILEDADPRRFKPRSR